MGKNDVEVTYTGKELYHLTDKDGSYDGKIVARGEGAYAIFETKSDWKDHSHKEYDKNGNETYNRQEGKNHKWDHRQKDFILSSLQNLSFEDLQYIECYTTNKYVKISARRLLDCLSQANNSFDEEILLRKKLR